MGNGWSRVRRILWGTVKLAVLAGIAGFAVYWVRFSPVDMETHTVATGTVVAEVMGTGTLQARVRTSVSPRITGRLATVLADQGDRVTAGQAVATLDDGDLRQQVEVARAELDVARAGVDRAAANIVRTRAISAQAGSSYLRSVELARGKIISDEELDRATQQRDVADADVHVAQLAKVESEKAVIQSEQSLRYYEERLADTRISAPFAGLVVRRDREPGDVVVPGSTIIEVVSTDSLWVSAWVDETAMGRLAVGQPARILFRSAPDASLPGKVARLSPLADAETREFLVDVEVDALPRRWAVGQRAEVYIDTGRREGVVVLPQRLVAWRGGEAGVLVEEAGAAGWRRIALGLRGREVVEVTEGLAAGRIVLGVPAGAEPPRDGRAVRTRLP